MTVKKEKSLLVLFFYFERAVRPNVCNGREEHQYERRVSRLSWNWSYFQVLTHQARRRRRNSSKLWQASSCALPNSPQDLLLPHPVATIGTDACLQQIQVLKVTLKANIWRLPYTFDYSESQ
ncbi:uncharacterized protein LOC143161507 [Aptenodytes patagonicus]|uniref:uncharacterized protein LOC143161507 n=1 Tax=Aptenodytes patagonicus TaxID=9234 RepID=UPI003F9F7610